MSTTEPLHQNEPYSETETERVEEVTSDIGFAAALGLRAIEIAALVLIGLLVVPPLFILVVVFVVPLVALAILVSLVAAVLVTPYLIVRHIRGHRGDHAVVRHRLGHAFHALVDIAPHRLFAGMHRSHPAP
jgi:hypothetical protein